MCHRLALSSHRNCPTCSECDWTVCLPCWTEGRSRRWEKGRRGGREQWDEGGKKAEKRKKTLLLRAQTHQWSEWKQKKNTKTCSNWYLKCTNYTNNFFQDCSTHHNVRSVLTGNRVALTTKKLIIRRPSTPADSPWPKLWKCQVTHTVWGHFHSRDSECESTKWWLQQEMQPSWGHDTHYQFICMWERWAFMTCLFNCQMFFMYTKGALCAQRHFRWHWN